MHVDLDFRAVFDASSNAYMLLDRQLRYVYANPAYLEVTASRLDQLIGRNIFDLFPNDPSDPLNQSARLLRESFECVLRTRSRHAIALIPYRVARSAGGEPEARYWSCTHDPILDERGEVALILQNTVDVTEPSARLSRERAELLRREQTARERAEAANQAKDEFLAMLGHELRNPLSPILTAVQLMKLRGDSQSQREQVIIERQAQHLVRLVDDLLDVSRIARGKLELRKAPAEIAGAVAKAVEIVSPLLEQKRHALSLEVPREGMQVFGDEARLAQIISNLLSNAARYTPDGGRIELTARRIGPELVLRVRDNGIGIRREMLPRIFDLFVQASQRSDRSEGGLGLGLTLVRNLVTMHGGRVEAYSAGENQGSEFVIHLPAMLEPQPTAAASNAPPALRPERSRVLVVDDNSDAAELLAQVLSSRGYATSVAFDGPSAIRQASSFEPEIAILDIGLPVMDGYELAARLRSTLGARCPRLIALTGYGQAHDRIRSREAGFFAHIVKPVDTELLFRTMAGETA